MKAFSDLINQRFAVYLRCAISSSTLGLLTGGLAGVTDLGEPGFLLA
jgi:hypothetical protein